MKCRGNEQFKKQGPSPLKKIDKIVFSYIDSMINFTGMVSGIILTKADVEVCKWLNQSRSTDDVRGFQECNGWCNLQSYCSDVLDKQLL